MTTEELVQELLNVPHDMPDRCGDDLYNKGEGVLVLAGPRAWRIERWVQEVAKQAGVPVDWHFVGGRAVICAMKPDVKKVRAAIEELLPALRDAARKAYELPREQNCGDYPLTTVGA